MPDLHGLSSRDANGECTNLERQHNEAITDLERRIAIHDSHVEELSELERQKDEASAKVSDLDRQLKELIRQQKELVAQAVKSGILSRYIGNNRDIQRAHRGFNFCAGYERTTLAFYKSTPPPPLSSTIRLWR
jgi:TolA-binding protein